MDFEIIDTVTADCLEENDIINLEGNLYEVRSVDDQGDTIQVVVREHGYDDDDTVGLNPDMRVSLYGYVSLEV